MHAYNNISVAFLSILLLYERNRVPLEEQIYEKSKRKRTRYALSLNVQSKPGGGVKENYFLPIFHSQTILWSAWNTRRFILKQRSDVYIGLYINMYWVDVLLFLILEVEISIFTAEKRCWGFIVQVHSSLASRFWITACSILCSEKCMSRAAWLRSCEGVTSTLSPGKLQCLN